MRRNAIVWTNFYDIMKDSFCPHITINSERSPRYFVNSYFLCQNCHNKYKILSNPKSILDRQLGILKL